MDSCQYFPVENSCKCFHQTELRQVSIIFRDTVNCNGIQKKLRDLVYGMSAVYSGGLVACIVAAVMETLLLCRKRNSKVGLLKNTKQFAIASLCRLSQCNREQVTVTNCERKWNDQPQESVWNRICCPLVSLAKQRHFNYLSYQYRISGFCNRYASHVTSCSSWLDEKASDMRSDWLVLRAGSASFINQLVGSL